MQAELAHHVGAVLVESFDADAQDHGGFLGRLALSDQPATSCSRAVSASHSGSSSARRLLNRVRTGSKDLPPALTRLDRVEQRLERLRLEHVAIRPERDGLRDERLLRAAEKKTTRKIVHLRAQLRQHFDAAEIGQHQVEQQHVGPQPQTQLDGLPPGATLADDGVARGFCRVNAEPSNSQTAR